MREFYESLRIYEYIHSCGASTWRDPYQCLLACPLKNTKGWSSLSNWLVNVSEIFALAISKSTFESFCTSFPTPSKISQLECLFTISNDKLPVSSSRSRFWGTSHANLQDQHLIYAAGSQLSAKAPSTIMKEYEWNTLMVMFESDREYQE